MSKFPLVILNCSVVFPLVDRWRPASAGKADKQSSRTFNQLSDLANLVEYAINYRTVNMLADNGIYV